MGQVQRRRLLVGGSALLAGQLARAQSPSVGRVPTIGYLSFDAIDPKSPPNEFASTKALQKLGWVDGQSITIERRFADLNPARLPGLAQELIRAHAEVIITTGSAATVTVARATSTIPIVFLNVPFPVELGLIDSFSRPGRNVTGTTTFVVGLGAKRFEFLRDIAPAAKRVYAMQASDQNETLTGGQFSSPGANIGRSLGFEVTERRIRESKDVETALAEALSIGAQALFVGGGRTIFAARHRIAEFALQHRLPSFSTGGGIR